MFVRKDAVCAQDALSVGSACSWETASEAKHSARTVSRANGSVPHMLLF
jgi:hypothetical protein